MEMYIIPSNVIHWFYVYVDKHSRILYQIYKWVDLAFGIFIQYTFLGI